MLVVQILVYFTTNAVANGSPTPNHTARCTGIDTLENPSSSAIANDVPLAYSTHMTWMRPMMEYTECIWEATLYNHLPDTNIQVRLDCIVRSLARQDRAHLEQRWTELYLPKGYLVPGVPCVPGVPGVSCVPCGCGLGCEPCIEMYAAVLFRATYVDTRCLCKHI